MLFCGHTSQMSMTLLPSRGRRPLRTRTSPLTACPPVNGSSAGTPRPSPTAQERRLECLPDGSLALRRALPGCQSFPTVTCCIPQPCLGEFQGKILGSVANEFMKVGLLQLVPQNIADDAASIRSPAIASRQKRLLAPAPPGRRCSEDLRRFALQFLPESAA